MADSILPQSSTHDLAISAYKEHGLTLYDKEVTAILTILTHINFLLYVFSKYALEHVASPSLTNIHEELTRASHDLMYIKEKLGIKK